MPGVQRAPAMSRPLRRFAGSVVITPRSERLLESVVYVQFDMRCRNALPSGRAVGLLLRNSLGLFGCRFKVSYLVEIKE